MRFQRIFWDFVLVIGVSNDKKKRNKENDYGYIDILILGLKDGSTLNGFDFVL